MTTGNKRNFKRYILCFCCFFPNFLFNSYSFNNFMEKLFLPGRSVYVLWFPHHCRNSKLLFLLQLHVFSEIFAFCMYYIYIVFVYIVCIIIYILISVILTGIYSPCAIHILIRKVLTLFILLDSNLWYRKNWHFSTFFRCLWKEKHMWKQIFEKNEYGMKVKWVFNHVIRVRSQLSMLYVVPSSLFVRLMMAYYACKYTLRGDWCWSEYLVSSICWRFDSRHCHSSTFWKNQLASSYAASHYCNPSVASCIELPLMADPTVMRKKCQVEIN